MKVIQYCWSAWGGGGGVRRDEAREKEAEAKL